MAATQYPVFINCRDRLTPLLALIAWLERVGQTDIYLLDNDSAYPPLLEYYRETPHRVVRLGANLGPHALWSAGLLDRLGIAGRFVLSDPDVVPAADCPDDAVAVLGAALDRFPDRVKAGLGLRLDDLPDRYPRKAEVLAWEGQFWETELAPGLYAANIDTTLALCRAGLPFAYGPGIRTGPPYLARHMPWYTDPARVSPEEAFYYERAAAVTHWTLPLRAPSANSPPADRAPRPGENDAAAVAGAAETAGSPSHSEHHTGRSAPQATVRGCTWPEAGHEEQTIVRILEATYGSGDCQADVTAQVQALVSDGRLRFAVSNGSLGIDPCPNRLKTLRLTYATAEDERAHRHEAVEGQTVVLPGERPGDGASHPLAGSPPHDVLVIVPTRGRPDSSVAFAEAFFAHSTRADLLFALDDDDPAAYPRLDGVRYEVNPRLRRVGTLNLVSAKYYDQYPYFGLMGDDHRIRTPAWDRILVEAIADVPAGIAYANDLLQGPVQPTAMVMKSDIVRVLGFLAPPALVHLYADNALHDIGKSVGSLRYRGDVVIEHLHYSNGKAEYDEIYRETNSPEPWARDAAAYRHYTQTRLALDVAKLKVLLIDRAADASASESNEQGIPAHQEGIRDDPQDGQPVQPVHERPAQDADRR